MGIFKKLTPLGRLVAIIFIVGVAGFATYKLTNNGKDISKISLPSVGNSYDATLLVDTYTGWAPIVWGNGGKDDMIQGSIAASRADIMKLEEVM